MSSNRELTDAIHKWSEVFMRRSGRDFKRCMDESGLSFSQIILLMRLYHGGKSGVSGIGEQLGITNAAASQSIDRLVNLGLIERTEDPEDRRAKQLVLTRQGQALITKSVKARSQWVEGLTKALTPEQQNMVIAALTLLAQAAQVTEE
ncbi:MAG TPA: MarR family winged helix-turn-helix transcriptional regulator [Anaerolineales bacterium]|nr:MarR family winged helix-turn-helix transcriptional regulator [Anaerolineales bacterium]